MHTGPKKADGWYARRSRRAESTASAPLRPRTAAANSSIELDEEGRPKNISLWSKTDALCGENLIPTGLDPEKVARPGMGQDGQSHGGSNGQTGGLAR